MLLEKIMLADKLPFTISFSNVAEEDFHYHKEMEVLLILRGTTKCKIHNVLYELKKGDVLIIDTQDMHRIYGSSEDILMLDMYVDLSYFEDLYPDIEYMIFACEDYSKASSLKYKDLQRKVSVLKHHIAKTSLLFFNERENHESLLGSIDDLIFNLVNQFQGFIIEDYKFKADQTSPQDIDLARLYKIIKYIYLNYNEKISLDDLSQVLYLSPYYISHLIKNTSGLSFQNFLNYVRLEHAEKMLIENKLNLTEISQACGFSSLSYFNKCFKTWYDISPSQYRKQLLPTERSFHASFSQDESLDLLKEYILNFQANESHKYTSQYSHHIFIPVRKSVRTGQVFDRTFPLNITISTAEDILLLNRHKEKIRDLNPNTILLNCGKLFADKKEHDLTGILNSLINTNFNFLSYNEIKDPKNQVKSLLATADILSVHSLAKMQSKSLLIEDKGNNDPKDNSSAFKAYESITKLPKQTIPLSSTSRSLFTLEGLPTPYYHVYSIFNEINGTITEQRDQYMIIKDDKNIYILVHQGDMESKLKAHIRVSELSGHNYILERKLEQKHSSYEILKALGQAYILSKQGFSYVEQFSTGSINMYSTNVDENLDLDYDLDPNSLMYIKISYE